VACWHQVTIDCTVCYHSVFSWSDDGPTASTPVLVLQCIQAETIGPFTCTHCNYSKQSDLCLASFMEKHVHQSNGENISAFLLCTNQYWHEMVKLLASLHDALFTSSNGSPVDNPWRRRYFQRIRAKPNSVPSVKTQKLHIHNCIINT